MQRFLLLLNILGALHFTSLAQAFDMGQMMPPIPKVSKLKGVVDGTLDVSIFKGKYVLIDLWATWCTPCVQDIPELIKLQEKMSKDMVIVSISLDTKPETLEEFFQKSLSDISKSKDNRKIKDLINYNVIYFKDQQSVEDTEEQMIVTGYPNYLLLDQEGRLIYFWEGSPGAKAFEETVRLAKNNQIGQAEDFQILSQLWNLKKEERELTTNGFERNKSLSILEKKSKVYPKNSAKMVMPVLMHLVYLENSVTYDKANKKQEPQKIAEIILKELSDLDLKEPVIALAGCIFLRERNDILKIQSKTHVEICEAAHSNLKQIVVDKTQSAGLVLSTKYSLFLALIADKQTERARALKPEIEKSLKIELAKDPENKSLIRMSKDLHEIK
jgi:thiol-disulfide isomerase/thioredoxin